MTMTEEVAPRKPRARGVGIERLEQRFLEMADREYVGDVVQPMRDLPDGTNTPEMKYRGSITIWMTGWAESAELIAVTSA